MPRLRVVYEGHCERPERLALAAGIEQSLQAILGREAVVEVAVAERDIVITFDSDEAQVTVRYYMRPPADGPVETHFLCDFDTNMSSAMLAAATAVALANGPSVIEDETRFFTLAPMIHGARLLELLRAEPGKVIDRGGFLRRIMALHELS